MHYRVAIIGSGPAGLTAALYAARANLEPVVIRGLQPGGLIATTDEVENYPGFPDAINGFDLAQKMEQQAGRFGTSFIDGIVEQVELGQRPFTLHMDNGNEHTTNTLIGSTGASPRKLNVPGELELANRGVSYCAVCDGFFFRNKRIVVVGGGNSAVEEGLFLTRFASEVVVVHRRDELRADPIIQQRAFNNPKMRILWDTVATEVLGNGKVSGIRLSNLNPAISRCWKPSCVSIHRSYSEHVAVRGADRYGRRRLYPHRRPHTHKSQAFLPPVTWSTIFTARRSPRPAKVVWRRWKLHGIWTTSTPRHSTPKPPAKGRAAGSLSGGAGCRTGMSSAHPHICAISDNGVHQKS